MASLFWTELRSDKSRHTRLLFAKTRIDNRASLRSALDLPEVATDDELLLLLYHRFGAACADHLLGDFAFAIWDENRGRVFAARDIMGCQPVYFSRNDKGFFIAERIEQLVENEEVSKREDEAFIAATVSYGYAHFERTGFAEIRKIPPGHFLLADENSITIESYWRPEQVPQRNWHSHEQCLEEFRSLLRRAVADRIPEEGRVGVHVSGGLDCSSIALLASEALRASAKPLPVALTWYPEPKPGIGQVEQEEYERLEAVCSALGVEPVYTEQTPDNVLAVLDRDNRVRPICNATYNEIPVFAEARRRGVTVIMSGFGGDEAASFDGRGYLEQLAVTGRWGTLAKIAKSLGRSRFRYCLSKLAQGLMHGFAPDAALRSFLHNRSVPQTSAFEALLLAFVPSGFLFWRKPSEERDRDISEARDYLNPELAEANIALPPIPIVRYSDTRAARCNLLRWPALMTRIESIEPDAADYGIRHVFPLMDRRIVEFALSLPPHVFQDENWKRLIFRQAMEPILPEEVCWRHAKSDPARQEPLVDAMMQAFASIGQRLQRTGVYPETAKYLDMPRLLQNLNDPALKSRSRKGRLIGAMELLGSRPRPEQSLELSLQPTSQRSAAAGGDCVDRAISSNLKGEKDSGWDSGRKRRFDMSS